MGEARIYQLADGKIVPGVTTILGRHCGWKGPGLIHWAWDLGKRGLDYRKERDLAADMGTLAHAWCQAEIQGKPLPPPPAEMSLGDVAKARTSFDSYLEWRAASAVRLHQSEVSLVSERYRYGGTIDGVGTIAPGEWHLIDFKTGKALYPEFRLQVAAYAKLWDENNPGCEIERVRLLRIGREGDFQEKVFRREELARDFEMFLCFLRVDQVKESTKKRKRHTEAA